MKHLHHLNLTVVTNDSPGLNSYTTIDMALLAHNDAHIYRRALTIDSDLAWSAKSGKTPLEYTALINNRIADDTAGTDSNIVTDNAVFDIGKRRNRAIIADAGSRHNAYLWTDIAPRSDTQIGR